MEKIITIEPSIVVALYGKQNANIDLLTHIFPKLKIIARGNEIKVSGEDGEVERFEERLHLLEQHIEEYEKLTETDILNITSMEDDSFYRLRSSGDVLVHGREGKAVRAITPNQKRLVQSADKNDMVFFGLSVDANGNPNPIKRCPFTIEDVPEPGSDTITKADLAAFEQKIMTLIAANMKKEEVE